MTLATEKRWDRTSVSGGALAHQEDYLYICQWRWRVSPLQSDLHPSSERPTSLWSTGRGDSREYTYIYVYCNICICVYVIVLLTCRSKHVIAINIITCLGSRKDKMPAR
ncbi:hypothetical protein P5V15_012778 [Pogonomyrmex californicus]